MIYDSGIWKVELEKKTSDFNELLKSIEFSTDWYFEEDDDGWTASYKFFIELQKYCFYAAVISRKFIESKRLSDELLLKQYKLKSFKKRTNKTLSKENFESIENEYDVDKESSENLTLEKICHLFVHSFIFNPKLIDYKIDEKIPDEEIDNWEIGGISGLYINTDFTKDKKVYYFELEQIFDLFSDVHKDDIIYINHNSLTGRIIRSNKLPNDD